MTLLTPPHMHAATDAKLLDPITTRWSTRAFDPVATVSEQALATILEAARWAPSASNTQPWRFIAARRGTHEFDTIVSSLMGFNQDWAGNASALIVAVTVTETAEGKPLRWNEYDLGQAVAFLTIQAVSEGLHLHQMGGLDPETLHTAFELPATMRVVSVVAIGELGDASLLPEPLRARESLVRERKSLDEIVLIQS